jgi:hypothetical protein
MKIIFADLRQHCGSLIQSGISAFNRMFRSAQVLYVTFRRADRHIATCLQRSL